MLSSQFPSHRTISDHELKMKILPCSYTVQVSLYSQCMHKAGKLRNRPLFVTASSAILHPISSSHPQCRPRKQQQQKHTLESEHFPMLHPNCGTVCPLLWESTIGSKLLRKMWTDPPVLRELDLLKLCSGDFFLSFFQAQWADCCSMDMSALYKSSSSLFSALI